MAIVTGLRASRLGTGLWRYDYARGQFRSLRLSSLYTHGPDLGFFLLRKTTVRRIAADDPAALG